MDPYGSAGAHIKTGKRYMVQDHFKTPPDPKKGHGMTKHPQKNPPTSPSVERVKRQLQKFKSESNYNQFKTIQFKSIQIKPGLNRSLTSYSSQQALKI